MPLNPTLPPKAVTTANDLAPHGLKIEVKPLPESREKQGLKAQLRGEAEAEKSPDSEINREIERLALLPLVEYGRERIGASKRLSISLGILDRVVEQARRDKADSGASGGKQGKAVLFVDPEPLPETEARGLDGAELLAEIANTFSAHLTLPEHASTVLALWVLFTWAHDAFQISPNLAITSPEKGCGKTSVLTLLGALTRKPLLLSSLTVSTLFRRIEKSSPTLLVDEADTFIHAGDELRGILNAGWLKASAFVDRSEVVGDNFEPRLFSVWCPKALAAIGGLPDTLADRSVELRMRRQTGEEQSKLKPLRADRIHQELEPLRRRLFTWTQIILADGTLAQREPELPEGFANRLADNWRPLFAIAEVAGEEWPERVRDAALAFQSRKVDESWGPMLLQDVHAMFEERDVDRLLSVDIVSHLAAMEERPWPACRKGERPIDARWLARKLSAFGVSPKPLRIDGQPVKGYELADFDEPFKRYCPKPESPKVGSEPVGEPF
ncbi:MAG: DUF3631 domain-containing protein [Terriglobia bacterium]